MGSQVHPGLDGASAQQFDLFGPADDAVFVQRFQVPFADMVLIRYRLELIQVDGGIRFPVRVLESTLGKTHLQWHLSPFMGTFFFKT